MKAIFTSLLCVILFTNSLTAQLNITEVGRLDYPNDVSDIWGYQKANGDELAIVTLSYGTSIVDISDPSNPAEIYFEPGGTTYWRDAKTWDKYAYIVTEASNGMYIIDLEALPTDTIDTYYFGSTYSFNTAHNIYIDENGVAYVFGSNYGNGGVIMLDVATDPMNPIELGVYDDYYLHDGVVRGDTLWASCINDGFQATLDVSNKSNPQLLATWFTPNNLAHNGWISDNGDYIFTTDEVSGGYVTSYDVSDLTNVQELDRWQSNPGTGTIPHNTHFMNNYLITSLYNDGISITDVTKPHRMVEVGYFDSSSGYSGNQAGGFHGAWGVYPWLPSGLILIADIEEGLIVVQPNYKRAAFIEGVVTDSCGGVIDNVQVEIMTEGTIENSEADGGFLLGTVNTGVYSVEFTKANYQTVTVSNVTLTEGGTAVLSVQMGAPNTIVLDGQVEDNTTPISSYNIVLDDGGSNQYTMITDVNGEITKCDVASGTYELIGGKWGYLNTCLSGQTINSSNKTINLTITDEGYQDNFALDLGWTVTGNASTGTWERGVPNGTLNNTDKANPDVDQSLDCGNSAYITGNSGVSAGDDDIDGGFTKLTSPNMDISNYIDPYVNFSTWFYNGGGSGTPDDYLTVEISDGGLTQIILTKDVNSTLSQWEDHSIRVLDYVQNTNSFHVIVTSEDQGAGHIVEAGFDNFEIEERFSCNVSVTSSFTGENCGSGDATATVNLVGGQSPYSYSWDNGMTNQTISGISSGSYAVTIMDDNSCDITTTVAVTGTNAVTVNSTVSDVACGGSDGSITVIGASGVTPYAYNWFNGETTNVVTGLTAGTYDLTVTDNVGCVLITSFALSSSVSPDVVLSISKGIDCYGQSDGQISAAASGTTSSYTFEWSEGTFDTGTSSSISVGSGNYQVEVTDLNGCVAIESISISHPDSIAHYFITTDIECNSTAGTAKIVASGGTGVLTYQWFSKGTSAFITGLTAGTYSVTISDVNDCEVFDSVQVYDNSTITPVIAITNSNDVLCNGGSDGLVTIAATGGTDPYEFTWSTGQINNGGASNFVSEAGNYSVVVKDANGCESSLDITISEPDPILIVFSEEHLACDEVLNVGSITATIAGGVGSYMYNWNTLHTTSTISGLSSGGYNLTVEDINGCEVVDSTFINDYPDLSITMTATKASTSATSDGSASANVTGGVGTLSYEWNTGATDPIISNLTKGMYYVTVTDLDNGCMAQDSIFVGSKISSSINELVNGNYLIYPNPVVDKLVVQVRSNGQQLNTVSLIEIMDTKGRVVFRENQNTSNQKILLDIEDLAPGVYWVNIVDERNERVITKLIKQ